MRSRPNVVFVFSDQHRASAAGYAGNTDVSTPRLDQLSRESLNFACAVSAIPVCSPNRATLLTGQYPLTHGLFINDIPMANRGVSIAEAYADAGYDTAYIGKWHIDGHGRTSFIPQERRLGFAYWRVLECTHDYNHSHYYGDTDELLTWKGYDAEEQTKAALEYIRSRRGNGRPFFLTLAWGPPHDPYQTAPSHYKQMYDPQNLTLRPNVPAGIAEQSAADLAGYYAHVTALDTFLGQLLDALDEEGISDNTVFVYTSDHGDMLGSQGYRNKQVPWDESVLVPLLIRYPGRLGRNARTIRTPINSPDIMPTLLGLSGIAVPSTVEGADYTAFLEGREGAPAQGALIHNISPFGQWPRSKGGKEYRGVRTELYTYVRDLSGPWLLYDNEADPYQLDNLCGRTEHSDLQARLDALLWDMLRSRKDEFLSGGAYADRFGYIIDPENGKVARFADR